MLGSVVNDSNVNPLRAFSVCYIPLCLVEVTPIGFLFYLFFIFLACHSFSFQSQMFWALISYVQVLKVGMSDLGTGPCALRDEAPGL